MENGSVPRDESVQTPRFHIEKYGYRNFAVYDCNDLVVVAVYQKGAREVLRRLSVQALAGDVRPTPAQK